MLGPPIRANFTLRCDGAALSSPGTVAGLWLALVTSALLWFPEQQHLLLRHCAFCVRHKRE